MRKTTGAGIPSSDSFRSCPRTTVDNWEKIMSGYPEGHGQVAKIKEQIDEYKAKNSIK